MASTGGMLHWHQPVLEWQPVEVLSWPLLVAMEVVLVDLVQEMAEAVEEEGMDSGFGRTAGLHGQKRRTMKKGVNRSILMDYRSGVTYQ